MLMVMIFNDCVCSLFFVENLRAAMTIHLNASEAFRNVYSSIIWIRRRDQKTKQTFSAFCIKYLSTRGEIV